MQAYKKGLGLEKEGKEKLGELCMQRLDRIICFGEQETVLYAWTLVVAGAEWIYDFAIISFNTYSSRLPGKGSTERHRLASGLD